MSLVALLLAPDSTRPYFVQLAGQAVIRHAAASLAAAGAAIRPLGPPARIAAALHGLPHRPALAMDETDRVGPLVAALEALVGEGASIALWHDAARPLIPAGTIPALLRALEAPGCLAAAPALAVPLLRRDPSGGDTCDIATLLQTPIAFRVPALLARLRAAPPGAASETVMLGGLGAALALVPGAACNIALTEERDAMLLETGLRPTLLPRTGTGFDVHAFAAGRPLVLCGITIPHDQGLAGHSDADVGIHALCDAIYGALAEGDIGRHFPPAEAVWKDADSARFLRHAAARIAARGGTLTAADITLICERPKIGPFAMAMRERLADLLSVPVGRVSVKATTTERLGFTGRGEGIAAQAAATLLLPES